MDFQMLEKFNFENFNLMKITNGYVIHIRNASWPIFAFHHSGTNKYANEKETNNITYNFE